jgi:hypothetical protein
LKPISLRMSGPYLANICLEQTNYKKGHFFPGTVEGFKVTLTKSDESRHISYVVYIVFHECVSIYNVENVLSILHKLI